MPSAAEDGATPAKVKVIVTRFVETDAVQFKSVVQSLTGKESTAAGNGWKDPTKMIGGVGGDVPDFFAGAAVPTVTKEIERR